MDYHLAQLNIARANAPMDDPIMADFQAALESINALADSAPGFVWRLQTEDGDATAIRPYEDERVMVNMSVWESIDELKQFVYRSGHTDVMRRRKEWFEPIQTYLVLWYVPAGHEPTVDEAKERLAYVHQHGPTPYAFTFKRSFPHPEVPALTVDDEIGCPA
jgi:hypothetical protein